MIPFRRRRTADRAGTAGLARALAEPTIELLPLKSAYDQLPFVPAGTWVSVTASPSKGLDATIDFALALESRGFRAIPHLSARMVRDRPHLQAILARLLDGGVDRAFVVGGDSTQPGRYPDGLSLLREIADLGVVLSNVGVPCYPDGHAFIPEDRLLEVLAAKAPFAHYVTTQLCIDPARIRSWILARRAEGFALPVQIGVAGAVEPRRLLSVSARIGVRDAGSFLVKNVGFVARLLRSGGYYRPDGLLDALAPLFGDPVADVRWVHFYTFNQAETTDAWRRRYLEGLVEARTA